MRPRTPNHKSVKFRATETFLLARPLAEVKSIDASEAHLAHAVHHAEVSVDYLNDTADLVAAGGEAELCRQYVAMADRMAEDAYYHLQCHLGHWA